MAKKAVMDATEKTIPAVTVLDRRLLHPFGSPSVGITLRSGNWEVRWVDAMSRPGRVHDMRHNKGWEFVGVDELDGTVDEYGLTAREGRLVRGENGREVLMKMPKDVYDRILARKTEINNRGVTGQALREAAAQETAVKYGPKAGDAVFNHKTELSVTNTRGADMELEAE